MGEHVERWEGRERGGRVEKGERVGREVKG